MTEKKPHLKEPKMSFKEILLMLRDIAIVLPIFAVDESLSFISKTAEKAQIKFDSFADKFINKISGVPSNNKIK